MDAERKRLAEIARGVAWRQWGPYLSERQWGTVREDYSPDGNAWGYFPHDHARSRAYRWGEDGLLGICDDHGFLCFATALWNGADPIIKERLFGLTGPESNHGEDVKEYYYFLDSTPSHAYMKALYKYPQRAYPYRDLVEENRRRGKFDPEFELVDTEIFRENRYFDVLVEYAKASPRDVLIRLSVTNRGPEPAPVHLLPSLWFRNTWSWGRDDRRPELRLARDGLVSARHPELGEYWLACEGEPELLFSENETNAQRLWGGINRTPYVKDGIDRLVVAGMRDAINPQARGTKMAAWYRLQLEPNQTRTVHLRLSDYWQAKPFTGQERWFERRQAEADRFYQSAAPKDATEEERLIQHQAFAGLLWSKQFYHYDVEQWLEGDPAGPPPPADRSEGRNHEWRHLNTADVLSMPDTWEYPWFAAWDLMFHCIPLAAIDPQFAKDQILLLLRVWYLHPNGQVPAYEWALGDVNPPVQAWAAWRVYQTDRRLTGKPDRAFLERVFLKLCLNFTWWVNRKDSEGHNVFQGGFLGLDNIGVFDRGQPLPIGGHLEQADGTAWMGMFCLTMLTIALELALDNDVYEDAATKFFEHFLYIAGALNNIGGDGIPLWNEDDQFFYDVLHLPDGTTRPLKVRWLVGLIPLLAVETIEPRCLANLPHFRSRLEWFLKHRPALAGLVSRWQEPGVGDRRLLALVRGHRMKALLRRMLDSQEFLSDYGVRALSRTHLEHPYVLHVDGREHSVRYEPAESTTEFFGGNSNWRGPIWFPVNLLLIEALLNFQQYYGDDFLVECPTGSGTQRTLRAVACELSRRLVSIFSADAAGRRPVFGENELFQCDPHWKDYVPFDYVPFYEYFDGDTGRGVGASHQTGWTALVAALIGELRPAGSTAFRG